MDLNTLNKQFQDRLIQREDQAVSRIQEVYLKIYNNLVVELQDLASVLAVLQASGKKISKNYLYQSTRLPAIITQLVEEMHGFSEEVSGIISSSQRDAVSYAIEDAPKLIKAVKGNIPSYINFDATFLRFDSVAAEQMIARFSEQSPIREAMERYVGKLISQVEVRFVQAIVKGEPARNITSDLVKHFGLSYVNAETSARTNIISSYRDANLERYKQSTVVKGWVWSATLDNRTCPVCVYMDGKEFDLDVPFATHPVCRCSPLPITKTWAELGLDNIPEFKPDLGLRGEEWFNAQSDAVQESILHKKKFELFKAGRITLGDLEHYFEDSRYGPSREEYSILDLKRLRVLK